MTDTEKLILEKLDLLGQEIREVKEVAGRVEIVSVKALETAERAEAAAVKATETAERAEAVAEKVMEMAKRAETTSAKALETAMKAVDNTQKIQLTLEQEISRKIDIIGEGHDFLNNKFDEACLSVKKREMVELEVMNLRMEVKKIKDHLDIA